MNNILFSLIRFAVCLSLPTLAQGKQSASSQRTATNQIAPTFKDAEYGSHPKELMNFWQFESNRPVGVLLQIHGGGWMGGKKDEALRPHQIKQGYHIASISYPLVNEGSPATCDVGIGSAGRSVYSFQSRGMENRYQSNRGDRWIRRRMLQFTRCLAR